MNEQRLARWGARFAVATMCGVWFDAVQGAEAAACGHSRGRRRNAAAREKLTRNVRRRETRRSWREKLRMRGENIAKQYLKAQLLEVERGILHGSYGFVCDAKIFVRRGGENHTRNTRNNIRRVGSLVRRGKCGVWEVLRGMECVKCGCL